MTHTSHSDTTIDPPDGTGPHQTVDGCWWEPLVDDRFGVIRRIEPEPTPHRFPRSFRLVSAVLADAACWSPWLVDSCGAGYAVGDQPSPVPAAVGEALERYCGNIASTTVRGSYAELTGSGRRAVDPAHLALFSDEQHHQDGFPFARFTADLVTDWAGGRELTTGEPVLAPAALVWASYPSVAADRGQAVTNPVYQPGLAAGETIDHAVLSGLLEVVERDTMVLAWHGGFPLAPIIEPPWLHRLARGTTGALETRFYSFPNPFGVDVVGALVRDRRSGYLTLGLAARLNLRGALLKAFGEALQLQRFVAGLDDPDGAYMTRVGASSPLKPWRRDRRYLDDYAADLADATDDGCNLQLHLDPRMQELFEQELSAAATGPPLDARDLDANACGAETDPAAPVGRLAAHLEAVTGIAPVVVDVTTVDVIAAGVAARVVRVLAPGLYANSSLAYPFAGGTRLDVVVDETQQRRSIPLPH